MKLRFAYMIFPILLLVVSSCVKDPEPTGGDPVNTEPYLQFIITLGTDPLPNAYVGLSNSAADRDDGLFFSSRYTGTNGKAEFEDLAEGTYFYTARYFENGNTSERKGSYDFVPNQNGEVVIRF